MPPIITWINPAGFTWAIAVVYLLCGWWVVLDTNFWISGRKRREVRFLRRSKERVEEKLYEVLIFLYMNYFNVGNKLYYKYNNNVSLDIKYISKSMLFILITYIYSTNVDIINNDK
jgi:hypothetical protein